MTAVEFWRTCQLRSTILAAWYREMAACAAARGWRDAFKSHTARAVELERRAVEQALDAERAERRVTHGECASCGEPLKDGRCLVCGWSCSTVDGAALAGGAL